MDVLIQMRNDDAMMLFLQLERNLFLRDACEFVPPYLPSFLKAHMIV